MTLWCAIAHSDLLVVDDFLARLLVSNQQASFGVRHGQINLFDSAEKNAMIGFRLEMNPSGLETPLGVPCQCCRRCLLVGVKKDPEPHHDLKTVADT